MSSTTTSANTSSAAGTSTSMPRALFSFSSQAIGSCRAAATAETASLGISMVCLLRRVSPGPSATARLTAHCVIERSSPARDPPKRAGHWSAELAGDLLQQLPGGRAVLRLPLAVEAGTGQLL